MVRRPPCRPYPAHSGDFHPVAYSFCDFLKEHPCLVPYEELPESEKEYDRNAALQTLKAIVALGYGIKKGIIGE